MTVLEPPVLARYRRLAVCTMVRAGASEGYQERRGRVARRGDQAGRSTRLPRSQARKMAGRPHPIRWRKSASGAKFAGQRREQSMR